MANEIEVATPVLKDKALWMSVLVPIALMLCKVFKLDVSEEFISKVLDVVLVFIVGSKGANVARAFAVAKIAGDAAKSAVVAPNILDIGNGK